MEKNQLIDEIREVKRNTYVTIRFIKDYDPESFIASIKVDEGLYIGIWYHFKFVIPDDWPTHNPTVHILNDIWHPNIELARDAINREGKVNIPALYTESTHSTITEIVKSIKNLIINPDPDNALNITAAEEFKNNYDVFKENASRYREELFEKQIDKNLTKEIQDVGAMKNIKVKFLDEKDPTIFIVSIKVKQGIHRDVWIHFKFLIPEYWPESNPTVHILDDIWHPSFQVASKCENGEGKIWVPRLGNESPYMRLVEIVESIKSVLIDPDPFFNLNFDAAQQFMRDYECFKENANYRIDELIRKQEKEEEDEEEDD